MNWIRANLDKITLWLFCWAGLDDVIKGVLSGDLFRVKVGVLWLIVGVIAYRL